MNEEERKMSKAANEASGTNEANKANGTYGTNGTVSQPQGKPLEPKTFLPKKGNYRGLIVYQKAECIYDITFYFAHHYFVERKDRTIDQVVQAARSAKQNIAEGCAAASTSAETEIKLIGVARASMKETLEDFKDYLRTRHLEEWSLDDPRTHQTQEFCKKHNRPEDYTKDIEKRSPETLCNIAITLICQYDVMMGRLLERLQKDFVEKGGIREQMTAARLGYRNEQKARIAELEAENAGLKARIAELERKVKELMGPMGLIGLIGPIGLMGLIRLMGLIGLMGLVSCSSSDDAVDNNPPAPVLTEVAISFSGSESQEEAVSNGGSNRANKTNRAYGTYGANRRAAGKPLSESGVKVFTVWGHKNLSYAAATGVYGTKQLVFPGYEVDWNSGSAATTTTNSNGWEYILTTKPDQTIKYWDFSAKAYRFFGVTGGLTGTDGTYGAPGTYWTSGTYGTYELTLSADASSKAAMDAAHYFSRLWFSTGDLENYPDKQFGKPVTLEFVKPFTRVRFLFKYAYPREGIKLSAISFKPTTVGDKIARKGTVTIHYPKEGAETKEWYTMAKDGTDAKELTAFTEDYDPEDDGKKYTETDEGWYVVLPNNTQGSYTLAVTVNGENKTAVVPEQYMQWLPGYSYTYIFKITNEGGVEIGWVEYAVTEWSEMEADHTVYNW